MPTIFTLEEYAYAYYFTLEEYAYYFTLSYCYVILDYETTMAAFHYKGFLESLSLRFSSLPNGP